MVKTPKGLRLHIGIFGRTNTGKSSILNAFVRQDVSIVAETAGTTTDPVEKTMELKPVGPVCFIDTAGIDDTGSLGRRRVNKTRQVIDRTELALLVTDDWTDYEKQLLAMFEKKNIPCVIAANKEDLRQNKVLEREADQAGAAFIVTTNAKSGAGIDRLREMVIAAAPREFIEQAPIIADLVSPGDLVVLVTPIDIEAPKGRLKMLQVNCMREILDKNALALVVKETELPSAMKKLSAAPSLVVCDSQVLGKVAAVIDESIPLTTFSILMARFKGDITELLRGIEAITKLIPKDRVLIAEACTHHPVGEDIGRVQLPAMLEKAAGGKLKIDVCAGRDFPDDIERYKVIIHCGACVFNGKEMLARIHRAKSAGVAITNYGLVIAGCIGLLSRAIAPLRKNDVNLKFVEDDKVRVSQENLPGYCKAAL